MEATIQGEVHGHDDFESALPQRLSEYDALIVEGRDDDGIITDLSIGYTLFLMGYIPAMKMSSGEDLESKARDAGIGYQNAIDADVHTIYHEMSSPLVRVGAFLFVCVGLYNTAHAIVSPFSGIASSVATFVVSWFAIFAIPMAFMATLAVASAGCLCGGLRDTYMADEVVSVAHEEEYESILVLCGQAHVGGIAEALEEKGWSVDRQQSQSLLGRVLRLLGKPLSLLCRTVGLVVMRLPGGKPSYLRDGE